MFKHITCREEYISKCKEKTYFFQESSEVRKQIAKVEEKSMTIYELFSSTLVPACDTIILNITLRCNLQPSYLPVLDDKGQEVSVGQWSMAIFVNALSVSNKIISLHSKKPKTRFQLKTMESTKAILRCNYLFWMSILDALDHILKIHSTQQCIGTSRQFTYGQCRYTYLVKAHANSLVTLAHFFHLGKPMRSLISD